MKKIVISNQYGSVTLGVSPFFLLTPPDFSGLQANVMFADNGSDGGEYLNSRFGVRDIDIQGYIDTYNLTDDQVQENRKNLYKIINPKLPVTVQLTTDQDEDYFLDAYPISFPVLKNDENNKSKNFQTFLLQLACPDPYLYKNNTVVTFATVTPQFSFPIQFTNVSMGSQSSTLIQDIYYSGLVEAPLEITMTAKGTITNPYLLNVQTQEQIKLNTTLQNGDQVYINTGRKKELSLIQNGVKTNYFYTLDLSSTFLNLHLGDNVIRFGADSGQDSLTVLVSYKEKAGGL